MLVVGQYPIFNVVILTLIQHQNVDRRCTNVGPMSKMILGQQIDDVIPTLSQSMIAIWEYTFQVSIIDYVLFNLYIFKLS